MIHVNNLQVDTRLLPLSFEVNAGEVLHVIGPNGCGKSTLLNAISGIDFYQGEVTIEGQDIAELSLETLAQQRAYLAQSQRPSFNLQVFQYLALHLPKAYRHSNLHQDIVESAVEQVTEMMNIKDKLHRSVFELSGGEWQRVRLAATALQVWPTLNSTAKLLILDEPAAPLDIGQQGLLYQFVDWMAQQGLTVIVANHDLNKTLKYADKVLMIKEGVKVAYGIPQQVMTERALTDLYDTKVRILATDSETVIVT
ncbi:vitamin B12 ABC transporter ATP-binding protein BtuD [Vibrio maerlii]|uniref:vitamin B12 ABC transporter ATP-binding protein BtuD n=1 Tax=Vibrio maerlii TaxID=2231648 RepID=UPI000E3C43A7|nr:vitamin B12 ABC transporter ATP-binding protein BtuD [Vibrio maerlii]